MVYLNPLYKNKICDIKQEENLGGKNPTFFKY